MAEQGQSTKTRHDPSPSFRFQVDIKEVTVAQFSECSGLGFQQEVYSYKEGGVQGTTRQFPTRFTFTNLTLKKGIAKDGDKLWAWIRKAVSGPTIEAHTITVTLFDVAGRAPLRTWVFQDAFPVKWSATALSADQNAIAVETLELAHQGILFNAPD